MQIYRINYLQILLYLYYYTTYPTVNTFIQWGLQYSFNIYYMPNPYDQYFTHKSTELSIDPKFFTQFSLQISAK
jgi:hypothetical protein